MSLNWSTEKIEDSEGLHANPDNREDGGAEWQVTKGLVFATMSIGLNKIEAGNVDEWLVRLWIAGNCFGEGIYPDLRWYHSVTRDDLERRIGLHTNAVKMTKAGFRKMLYENLESTAKRKTK